MGIKFSVVIIVIVGITILLPKFGIAIYIVPGIYQSQA